jgi:GGDEF domain-containing protein
MLTSKSPVRTWALSGALLMTALLLALEFDLVEHTRDYSPLRRHLQVTEILIVASLLASCLVTYVVQWKHDEHRDVTFRSGGGTWRHPDREFERAALVDALQREFEHGQPFALLLLELGDAETVDQDDDQMSGDDYVQILTRLLEPDMRDGGIVLPLGVNSFAVVLRGASNRERAIRMAEAFAATLGEPARRGARMHRKELAAGVACHPDEATTADALLARAQVAMNLDRAAQHAVLRYLNAFTHVPAV